MSRRNTIVILIALTCLIFMPYITAQPGIIQESASIKASVETSKATSNAANPSVPSVIQSANGDYYFVHLTDPHITDSGRSSYGNFRNVLNTIRDFHPQPAFIVITGDLVHYGSKRDQQWPGDDAKSFWKTFRSLFYHKNGQLYLDSHYEVPVYTCPGNHDYLAFIMKGAVPMSVGFSLDNYYDYIREKNGKWGANYCVEYQNSLLIFLDSGHDVIDLDKIVDIVLNGRDALVASESNGLSDTTINFLRRTLQNYPNVNHKMVFMHHPVFYSNNKCYITKNKQKFIDLISSHNVDVVFSGHTHCQYNEKHHGCRFVTTDGIKEDNSAFRVISIDNGEIKVQVSGIQPRIKASITRPMGGLYLFDRQVMPLIGQNVVIGPVTITVQCSHYLDEVDRVEFYVNEGLEHTVDTVDSSSCSWVCDMFGTGNQRTIKVVAYDALSGAGFFTAEDSIEIIDYL